MVQTEAHKEHKTAKKPNAVHKQSGKENWKSNRGNNNIYQPLKKNNLQYIIQAIS